MQSNMSDETLTDNLSRFSLDSNGQQEASSSAGKKHKRPHRAFHNINGNVLSGMAGVPPFPTGYAEKQPQLDASLQQGVPSSQKFQEQQSAQVFTPKPFNTPSLGAGSSIIASPQLGSLDLKRSNSTYMSGSVSASHMQNMSYILAAQRWEDQMFWVSKYVETSKDTIPPLATSQFYCIDQGLCDPRLMSISMYNIPFTEQLRSATKLPLGLTVQPFADLIPDDPIPLVEANDNKGPLRCKRCRTYVNPSFQFTYDSAVVCTMCSVKMKIPAESAAPLGADGKRVDMPTKSELYRGTVDFLVPEAYNAIQDKPNQPLHYIFLIDCSLPANENGSSIAMVNSIKSSVEYIAEKQPNCKVAILAFDNKLRFYNLRAEQEKAHEYIITEIDDIFLPFYEGLFVKPAESMHVIQDTLDKISAYITLEKNSHTPAVCYGAALQAAKLALDTVTGQQGGKIICSLSTLPTTGPGELHLKKDDASKKFLKCDVPFYSKLATSFLKSNISLDLYVATSAFVDLANIAYPVLVTSGTLKYYSQFIRDEVSETRFVNDVVNNISQIVGYQAQLKVRCSSGLSVAQYYSESCGNSKKDPIIPVITKNTNVDVLLEYDEKLKNITSMHFQAALLYTDINGFRKVRSINTTAPVAKNINDIFKSMNQNVMMRVMIKEVCDNLGECDFGKIRQSIFKEVSDMLTQYRTLVSGNSSSQLVLPDALKTLITYMLSFQKSALMRPNNTSTRGNDRIYDYYQLYTSTSAQLCFKLYPQIVPLHVLLQEKDLTFYDANYKMLQLAPESLPDVSIPNSHTKFVNGGCYAIFNGGVVYLWLNENTNKMLLKDLMNADKSTPTPQLTLPGATLPHTGTAINKKAHNLLRHWCQITNQRYVPVLLLRPSMDSYFNSVMSKILCEDQTMSKVEANDQYLIALHHQVQQNISKQDYIKISGPASSSSSSVLSPDASAASEEHIHQKFVQF